MDEQPETPAETPNADAMLAAAKADGKLAPLEKWITSSGANTTAEDVMKAAQSDERTRGKPPEELAAMLEDSDSLLAELMGPISQAPPPASAGNIGDMRAKMGRDRAAMSMMEEEEE